MVLHRQVGEGGAGWLRAVWCSYLLCQTRMCFRLRDVAPSQAKDSRNVLEGIIGTLFPVYVLREGKEWLFCFIGHFSSCRDPRGHRLTPRGALPLQLPARPSGESPGE
ncbi:hypothetical protein ILYODFUR_031645 [Ilyodon furcidens]|uniref:Uncharacterized protein n=1 Tax=Ilyodon furcidens TaxID=33524 RepID=A0ABV0TZD0_9TELE